MNPKEAEVRVGGIRVVQGTHQSWGHMGRKGGEGDQVGSRGFGSRGIHLRELISVPADGLALGPRASILKMNIHFRSWLRSQNYNF